MSKLCVTCQDSINSLTDQLFSRDDEEIPDWFMKGWANGFPYSDSLML